MRLHPLEDCPILTPNNTEKQVLLYMYIYVCIHVNKIKQQKQTKLK